MSQSLLLYAQNPYYYRINEENGLPSSEVYQIIQDDFGYIWIGCDAGLYRYDGIRFKSFTSGKQNSKSISGLKIDKDKNLWCQNFSGQIFRVSGDSLSLVIDVSNRIISYSQYTIDNEKHIWIANIKTIEAYDFKGKKIVSISKLNNSKDTILWQEVETDASGAIYLSSQVNSVAMVDKSKGNYEISFLDNTTTEMQRTAFEPYGNGLIALSETNIKREYVISLVSNKSVVVKNRFLPFTKDGLIYKVYKDNLNRHWLCTSSGMVKLNADFKLDHESKFFLKHDKISCVYQDREGNLWISSLQNGIYVIPDYNLSLYDEVSSDLSDHNITAILKTEQNELLLGTYSGSVYKLTENNTMDPFPRRSEISYRTVKKMDMTESGLYVAHGPLSCFTDRKETLFNAYNFRDFGWLGDSLFFVTSGMFGFYPNFHTIPNSKLGLKTIIAYNRGCRSMTIDRRKRIIYFAAIDGLFSYYNGKIEELTIKGRSLYANKLSFENGCLYVGSVNDGIYVFKDKHVVEHYYNGKLLEANGVRSIKVSGETIYAATNAGFSIIDRRQQIADFYGYADGIVSKEVNAIEYWNGSVYLATNKGLLKLPTKLSKNCVRPGVEITGLEVNHKTVVLSQNKIGLEYNENAISISFNTACLKARGDFKYKYRLLGLDSNWFYNSGINNQINYSSLPAGDFIFEVKAVNEDGFESEKADTIEFHIDTPFWQRWWFYAFIILITSAIVAALFVIRIRFIKRRAELKNKVTASQLTALKSQMNPHFLFNTLNSLQDLILKHDIKNSNYYLNKFSVLMREVLDISGKDEIALSREIKLLDTYLELEKLRFGEEFKFAIITDDMLDADHLMLPPMIIQPFIENAVKHGLLHKKGRKFLSVEFKLVVDVLICTILDNGVGRKRSEEIKARNSRTHQSFATEATDKRMDLLNSFNDKKYSFEIIDLYKDSAPIGTKVVISIPV